MFRFLWLIVIVMVAMLGAWAAADNAGAMVTAPATAAMSAQHSALVAKRGAAKTDAERALVTAELATLDQELILAWAHGLKFADGRTFSREFTPERITDDALAVLFPDTSCYTVLLPGYFGGAAPPEELLRSLEVPEPLQRINVIVVGKDATIQLLTTVQSREEFFRTALPPVTTEVLGRQAVAGWLRLAGEYIWEFNVHPTFTINEKDFTAAYQKIMPPQLVVTGKAVADPKSNAKGDITTTMVFSEKGELLTVTEIPQVVFGFIPLPPAAAPHGGHMAE